MPGRCRYASSLRTTLLAYLPISRRSFAYFQRPLTEGRKQIERTRLLCMHLMRANTKETLDP